MELSHIGLHCHFVECNQLDFLPIGCPLCKQQFCKLHSKDTEHNCQKIYDKTISKEDVEGLSSPASFACSLASCRGRELAPISCDECKEQFCLRHRLPPDHDCKCIEVKPKSEYHGLTPNEKVEKITGKTLSSDKSTGRVGKKSKKTSNKVLEMKLKMKATGETSIPGEERVYFDVKINVPGHTVKSIPLYFSKEYTIGKTVDLIAKYTKLKNQNHVASAPKLKLYVLEDEYFAGDLKLDTLVSDNNIDLNDFGELFIKYV